MFKKALKISEILIDMFTPDKIVTFLHTTKIFNQLDPQVLQHVALSLKVVSLKGGEILIKEGETTTSLYIIANGRLRATSTQEGKEKILGEIGRGEIVGEIALIIGGTRTATVKAVRDSVLFELTSEEFNRITQDFPQVAIEISRFCIKRLSSKKPRYLSNASTIVFAPASDNAFFSDFVAEIVRLLEKIGTTLHLNQKTFNELYGQTAAQTPFDRSDNSRIIAFLHDQEEKYHFVVYETDIELTQWTRRCFRQADQILLVGNFNAAVTLNPIETELFKLENSTHIKIELILLHNTLVHPHNTAAWLQLRPVKEHYHLRYDSYKDYQKLIRFITGSATGLVLAGGGSRAVSYVGLFHALEEMDISFDRIAGNSFGAMIGGLYAMGLSHIEIFDRIKEGIKQYRKPLVKYTLPLVALFDGKFVFELLTKYFDDICIEDLWTPFFCTSSNLSNFSLKVHDRGCMWKGIRASLSAPGLFPPVVAENGDLLVDGGIINNMPVDVMRQKIGSGKILAVSVKREVKNKYAPTDNIISGYKLLLKNILREKNNFPNIIEIIISSMELLSEQQEADMIAAADYFINLDAGVFGLTQTKGIDEMVNRAYHLCRKQLAEFSFLKKI